jgi:hypothetical protein
MRSQPSPVSFPDLGLLVQYGLEVTFVEVNACYSFAKLLPKA